MAPSDQRPSSSSPDETERIDLRHATSLAKDVARELGLTLERPYSMSNVSYVAPAGDVVVKVPWHGDDESLHEGDALQLWDGVGAVRLLDRRGRALVEERLDPGDDLSTLENSEHATAIAVGVAQQLWRRGVEPFRPVSPEVERWVDRACREGAPLAHRARALLRELDPRHEWLVHGDFHHHNLLRRADEFVAIDPKPYLSEREYDVPPFLWNPMGTDMRDARETERRIAAFVAIGLDDYRIRAWTVIRGSYLRAGLAPELDTLICAT